MIVLLTDFGPADPYVGQMKAVLHEMAPGQHVVDLCHQLPDFDPCAAAYFIPAYTQTFPAGTVFLCVVDPGVGTERAGIALLVDQHWYVGPDNGLFSLLVRRGNEASCWYVTPPDQPVSASFHGRDVFAPVAARLAQGDLSALVPMDSGQLLMPDWPEDLPRIIYIDHYGNLISGYRYNRLPGACRVRIAGQEIVPARTFADVPVGSLLYYENANGLLEIAANQASAAAVLGVGCGEPVEIS